MIVARSQASCKQLVKMSCCPVSTIVAILLVTLVSVSAVVEDSGDSAGDNEQEESAALRDLAVQLGHTAFLRCHHPVSSGLGAEISWLRRSDWHLLTTGNTVFTSDERVRIFHDQLSGDWVLKIRLVLCKDSGVYECQISTSRGKLSQLVNMTVVQPVATILGKRAHHVQKGSTLSLLCRITKALSPPAFINWYHNKQKYNIYNLRDDIKVSVLREVNVSTSYLNISDVRETDVGSYTCSADHTLSDTINVFVSQGDKMAAIQRRKGSSGSSWLNHCVDLQDSLLLLANLLILCVIT